MKLSYKSWIVLSFCAAIFVLLAVAAGVYSSFLQMNWQKARVEHTYKVIETLQDVMSNLKDVQSAQRGYVITGMEDYLTPYYIAEPKIRDGITALEKLVSDNDLQVRRSAELSRYVEGRLTTAGKVIEIYRSKGEAAAFDIIREGSGKREMDHIRAVVGEMIVTEQDLLHTRRDAVENYSRITMYAGAAGLMFCVGILALVFFFINREAAHRAATEQTPRTVLGAMKRISCGW